MRILVIEDEVKTAAFIRKGLRESGYTADVANEGFEGLDLALTREYDIIILDVMLPGLDGWQIISRIRKLKKDTPIIFLTARDAIQDRIKGLELGADDYLVKPFAFSELLVRIRTILRRGPVRTQELITIGDLEIDLMGHRVTRGGKRLDLTPKEFALISLLARRSGEVLTRVRIAERIWDIDFESDTNVVDVHMRRLRAKVDDPFEKKLIHTVRGVGYVLEER
ncbi:winged helix-turn-helix heavy metal transcriptional response regulator [Geotalea daltonii FRC-32]|uniref:Winged helix-turn-helix heavy metal transcriptional response regulator n=1 Tax=Geotalea daltonii (strain DSM 22248 / JCM 15807 / FRC-32) TaxID=316067 RepID=B9M457_GEODF|nr:heavy metal response regulator transcription factor [Geotalea daltonii]ACM21512.1 winged helix-turn-helix heavy metal transcriptional response regulator [Geotalea daltonii FRC-32]